MGVALLICLYLQGVAEFPLAQEDFIEWVKSLVTGSDHPEVVDAHGLRRCGWRPGTSICASWPQIGGLFASSRREEIYYYKAGGPCGDKFDLCKVMCMSDLTPWALSSAFFCSAADCVLVACSVPDQRAAGQARVGREFSRCSVVSSALQLVSLRTPRHLIVFMQAGAFGGPKVLCALIGACRFLVSGGRRSMHLPSAGVAHLPCRACH